MLGSWLFEGLTFDRREFSSLPEVPDTAIVSVEDIEPTLLILPISASSIGSLSRRPLKTRLRERDGERLLLRLSSPALARPSEVLEAPWEEEEAGTIHPKLPNPQPDPDLGTLCVPFRSSSRIRSIRSAACRRAAARCSCRMEEYQVWMKDGTPLGGVDAVIPEVVE